MERHGDDLRSLPLEERKARLRSLLVRSKMGIVYSDHVAGDDGAKIFAAACEIGLEGIVSKRRDRPYVSGNHFAKCGKINIFQRGSGTVTYRDFDAALLIRAD